MATAPWTTLKFPHSYRPAPPRWPPLFHAWMPVLFFSAIFAIESTAAFGSNRTSAPLHAACQALLGTAIDPRWSEIHHWIRKIGHFAGYGFFSLVCFRAIFLSIRQKTDRKLAAGGCQWIAHGMAIASVFLVATADEIHQTFLPNRTGCFADVLLDTAGALVLQACLFLALHLIGTRPKSPANSLPASSQPRLQPAA